MEEKVKQEGVNNHDSNTPPKEQDKGGNGKGGNKRKRYRKPKDQRKNDLDWYTKMPTLFNQSTSVNQFFLVGQNPDKIYNDMPAVKDTDGMTISGTYSILVNDVIPTLGGTTSSSDPINQVIKDYYNKVRGKYTSTVPFEPADLGMYFIAMGSIINYHGYISKLLGLVNVTVAGTKLVPDALLRAHNIRSPQSERALYAENIYRFNKQNDRLSGLSVPVDFAYFKKCAWFSRHIFQSGDDTGRTSFISNRTRYLFQWSSTVPTADQPTIVASGLTKTTLENNTAISQHLTTYAQLIDALVDNDDVRQISGWIQSNGGVQGGISKMTDYLLKLAEIPAYCDEFLMQYRNAVPAGFKFDLDTVISQNVEKQFIYEQDADYHDVDTLSAMPQVNSRLDKKFLGFNKSSVTAADIMLATRFIFKIINTNPMKYTCDTWIIENIYSYYIAYNSDGIEDLVMHEYQPILANQRTFTDETETTFTSEVSTPVESIALYLNNVDKPNPFIVSFDGYGGIVEVSEIVNENWTFLITAHNLENLNYAAIYSEFFLGKYPGNEGSNSNRK